jgi:SAM-dependent methyltransferase
MTDFSHPVSLWDHFNIGMIRDFPRFIDTYPVTGGLYLHLGSGRKTIDGSPMATYDWRNLDYPEWDANKDQLPYDDESVDGIFTSHAMDHFARPVFVLAEAQRVLKVGGWFVNIAGHYTSELAHNCFEHRTRFATDVWKNAFSDHYYDTGDGAVDGDDGRGWKLRIGFNMIMGLTERNTVLVTQLIRTEDFVEY